MIFRNGLQNFNSVPRLNSHSHGTSGFHVEVASFKSILQFYEGRNCIVAWEDAISYLQVKGLVIRVVVLHTNQRKKKQEMSAFSIKHFVQNSLYRRPKREQQKRTLGGKGMMVDGRPGWWWTGWRNPAKRSRSKGWSPSPSQSSRLFDSRSRITLNKRWTLSRSHPWIHRTFFESKDRVGVHGDIEAILVVRVQGRQFVQSCANNNWNRVMLGSSCHHVRSWNGNQASIGKD